jgi:hypothetical protein
MSISLCCTPATWTRNALFRPLLPWLGLAWLWAGPSLAYAEVDAGLSAPPSAVTVLLRLAERVQTENEFDRVDFAWVAIAEMAASFEAAAEGSAQARAKNEMARKKLLRWRSSTLAYAQHLRERLMAIQQGAPVAVHVQEPNTLVVFTDGEPTVINGPQAVDYGELARQILLSYCALHLCPEQEMLEAEAPPDTVEPPNGQWSFGQDLAARYETPDGLAFEFRRLQVREDAQNACDRLITELRVLANRLRQLHQAGAPVAWERLRILSTGAPDQHRVLVNDAGRSLLLSLPNLYLVQELLREAAPWLEAQAEGATERQVFARAERFTGLLPNPIASTGPARGATPQSEPEMRRLRDY